MKKNGEASWRVHMRAHFTVSDAAFRSGEEILVHMPVPKIAVNMQDIEILAASHPVYKLAGRDAPARTVSFKVSP